MCLKNIILILVIFFTFLLNPVLADNNVLPSQTGIVNSVHYVDMDNEAVQTKQVAEVKLLSGEFKGENVILENVLTGNPYYDIKIKNGVKVILHAEDNGSGIEYSIEDIKRSGTLAWLSLIFCGLLIYVGKRKGVYSLLSIILTIILILNVLKPLILIGVNPIFSTLLICIVSTAVTMYLVGGFNAKSTAASIGAILSLCFAAVLSLITMYTAHLSGFANENSMFLYSAHPELNIAFIAISMIVLATLGAVMDVAMSIASTINEIYLTDNTKSVKDLFLSGMNVGRDIIGTMANTLILVYLGGALSLVLLSGNIDIQKFINLNQVVTEIASALIGSIAIVICVPFTASVASMLIHFYAKKAEQEKLPWENN